MQARCTTPRAWPPDRSLPAIPVWPVAPPDPDPDPDAWPNLWARCWARIRSWKRPPRWSAEDWYDEARAQGALAACEALRDFDPSRGVPRSAYLYQKVVAAAWTRYRQEWTLCRRTRALAASHDRTEPGSAHPDPETIERLASTLDRLPDADRLLIVQLFWEGRTEGELAATLEISQQGVNRRKRRIMQELRSLMRAVAGKSSGAGCEIA